MHMIKSEAELFRKAARIDTVFAYQQIAHCINRNDLECNNIVTTTIHVWMVICEKRRDLSAEKVIVLQYLRLRGLWGIF